MERITYPLAHPIEIEIHDGATAKTVTIAELHLAPRVKGRHMRAADHAEGPVEAKLLMISSLAGISRAEADELDEVDILGLDSAYGSERSDLQRIAVALGLVPNAPVDAMLAAIAAARPAAAAPVEGGAVTGMTPVPLPDGAGSPADGPATPVTSPPA